MFLCVAFGLAFAPLCWRLLHTSASRFAQLLVAPWELRMHVSRFSCAKTVALHRRTLVLDSSGLQIELEKEARKAQVSSLLQNGIATQLTKAKARVAKDSANEFLHEQLSGHPDHFAQRNWVSWQLLLVAARSGRGEGTLRRSAARILVHQSSGVDRSPSTAWKMG